jgi:hypothetical protein
MASPRPRVPPTPVRSGGPAPDRSGRQASAAAGCVCPDRGARGLCGGAAASVEPCAWNHTDWAPQRILSAPAAQLTVARRGCVTRPNISMPGTLVSRSVSQPPAFILGSIGSESAIRTSVESSNTGYKETDTWGAAQAVACGGDTKANATSHMDVRVTAPRARGHCRPLAMSGPNLARRQSARRCLGGPGRRGRAAPAAAASSRPANPVGSGGKWRCVSERSRPCVHCVVADGVVDHSGCPSRPVDVPVTCVSQHPSGREIRGSAHGSITEGPL